MPNPYPNNKVLFVNLVENMKSILISTTVEREDVANIAIQEILDDINTRSDNDHYRKRTRLDIQSIELCTEGGFPHTTLRVAFKDGTFDVFLVREERSEKGLVFRDTSISYLINECGNE